MYIKRKIDEYLEKWKNNADRLPYSIPEREVIYGKNISLPHLSQQDPKQAAGRDFRLQQIRV